VGNVLIVIPDHKYGGEENRSFRIYKGLKDAGLRVDFVSESTEYEFDDADFKPMPGLNSSFLILISMVKLFLMIRKRKPKVVLLFKRKSSFVGWVLEKAFPKTNFVFNVANAWQEKMYLWKFVPRHVCTLSEKLIPEDVSHSRAVKVIKIGVPLSHEKRISEKILHDGVIRLISAGKLNYQKNHLKLIKLAKELMQRGHKVVVDIAGDGPKRGELESLATELGVNVNLRGQVKDMQAFYSLGGIYVQVSNFEGMPNALLEAANYSIPIVANDVGATGDLVDTETGWLVTSNSLNEFCLAIEEIAGDAPRALMKANNMREKVLAEYDVRSMCQKYTAYVSALTER
jgi:glycosyltransferase involved in cell wall biosynthesis